MTLPNTERGNDIPRPVISAVAWPWKHPEIEKQNQLAVDAGQYTPYTSHGYRTYLLDPPVSAYDLFTPLPVRSYAKYMYESWWNTDYRRFGHQALKIPLYSTDPSSQLKTLAKASEGLNEFLPFLTSVIRSRISLAFITTYAVPQLYKLRQVNIMMYLMALTRDAATATVMRNRLHYEKRSWPTRLRRIQDQSATTTQSFDTVWDTLIHTLQRPLSENTAVDAAGVIQRLRELLAHLMELNRKFLPDIPSITKRLNRFSRVVGYRSSVLPRYCRPVYAEDHRGTEENAPKIHDIPPAEPHRYETFYCFRCRKGIAES